jgi:hypothetical protein
MSLKYDKFPISIDLDTHFNPYLFDGTEFQPVLLHRKNERSPSGGESIVICWNYDQAEEYFHSCSYPSLLVLCLNLDTMTMNFCADAITAKEFYKRLN